MATKKVKDVIVNAEAAKDAVKKTEEKAATKAVEVKEAVKKEVKKEAAPAKEAVKKEVKKETAPAKEAAKKAVKKADDTVKAAKTAKKAATAKVVLQYAGKDIAMADLLDAAKKAYAADNKEELKDIVLYVKPEDNAAYYVANNTVTGKITF